MVGTGILTEVAELLYKSVLADPLSDDNRLIMADALEEVGHDDRAHFIRKQIELARIGPTPVIIEETLRPGGPDYFSCDADAPLGSAFRVGDRVTVRDRGPLSMKNRSKGRGIRKDFRMFHNLLVMRVEPSGLDLGGEWRLSLKRDEYSKAYPKKTVGQLRKECFDLIKDRTLDELWFPGVMPGSEMIRVETKDKWEFLAVDAKMKAPNRPRNGVNPGDDEISDLQRLDIRRLDERVSGQTRGRWMWERGFVSVVHCPWQHWIRFGDWLTARAPISSVFLHDYPEYEENESRGAGRTYIDVGAKRIFLTADQQRHLKGLSDQEATKYHLHLRWPTIKQEHWVIPDDERDDDLDEDLEIPYAPEEVY